MAHALTTASMIRCPHGAAASTSSPAKLKVNGQPVLLASGATSWPLATPPCTQVGSGLTPCTSIASVSAGRFLKLRAGGEMVVGSGLAGMTNGLPTNTPLSAAAVQIKLTAT